MRILVTGANGQVGHELLRALSQKKSPPLEREEELRACEIIPATRNGALADGTPCERIDLSDLNALRDTLDRMRPDLIVNAAAYTAVDRAEDEPELAQRINAEAVGTIGAWAAQHDTRVVHYSTDYVFDGCASRPYREDDAKGPLAVYGRSKLAGEIALTDSGARHLVLRTAWVYAARGKNFLLTMLRLGAERDELRVVDDQVGAPTPARLIADVSAQAIARWYAADAAASTQLDGTYHVVASGQTSWCGFARAIFERADTPLVALRARSLSLRPSKTKGEENYPLRNEGGRAQRGGMPPRVIAIATADYATRAARPAYSVLDTTKLRTAFGVELPDWQTALDGVVADL